MNDKELIAFFEGHGYEPYIVDATSDTNIYANRFNHDLEKIIYIF